MPVAKGRQTYLAIKREASRGQAEGTPNRFFSWKSLNANLKLEMMTNNSAFGRRESVIDSYDTSRSAEGSTELVLDADTVADILFYIYGQVSTVQDGTTGAYTHTFNGILNNTESPTFTLWHSLGDAGHKRQYSCLLKDAEIEINENGEGTLKTSWISLDEENIASGPTIVLAKPNRILLGKTMIARFASTIASLSTGTTFKITSFNIKFDTGAKFDTSFNNGINNATLADGTTFELSFKSLVRSADFYDRFKGNIKTAFSFDLTALYLPLIGSSSTLRPRLAFDIAPSSMEINFEKPLDDFIASEIKIKPEFSFVDGFAVRSIVVNSIPQLGN